MTRPETDAELLAAAWRLYAAEFTDYVGEIVDPAENVDTEAQANWATQVFMFGYALGSVAGAHAVAPDTISRDTDLDRVDEIVETVTDISASDEFDASKERIRDDFGE